LTEQIRPTPDPLASVQLMAIADEIASTLRHELRNKFSSVRSAGFYIRRRLRNTEPWQADPRLEDLSGIIQSEMGLASELLDRGGCPQQLFTRAVTQADAQECVRRAVAWARIPGERASHIDIDAQPGCILVDPSELVLAVRCLVENAAEASDAPGAVQVRAAPEASRYVIQVSDGGSGISESQRESVLNAFYTTKPGHVGLGLNIARRIAQRYEGALSFCEASTGATVALYFNLCPTELSSAGARP
jgi:signal transduction histidine kinase